MATVSSVTVKQCQLSRKLKAELSQLVDELTKKLQATEERLDDGIMATQDEACSQTIIPKKHCGKKGITACGIRGKGRGQPDIGKGRV